MDCNLQTGNDEQRTTVPSDLRKTQPGGAQAFSNVWTFLILKRSESKILSNSPGITCMTFYVSSFVPTAIVVKLSPTMSFLRGSPQANGAINPERIEMATAEYELLRSC